MKLCLIRHAESLANAVSDLDNPTYYYDAKITQRGISQAKKLHNRIKDLSFDKYFCSPLTRTIETFSIIFPNHKPVFEPLIREHLYHSCDVGRQPKTLKKIFKKYDFSKLENYWWNNNIPINEKIDITFKKPSFFFVFKYLKAICFSNSEIKLFLTSFYNFYYFFYF